MRKPPTLPPLRLALLMSLLASCGAPQGEGAESAAPEIGEGAGEGEPTAGAASACAPIAASDRFHREVAGEHRACASHDDCVSTKLDCSNMSCSAVHRDHEARYREPIDCSGYSGPMANYDCDSRFGAERPVCVEGCCASVRIDEQATASGRATMDEACQAIAVVYERDHCTVFGPTFAVSQCARDVVDIRSEARSDAAYETLQAGLDCARSATTCAEIERCVRAFRGGQSEAQE